MTDALSRIVNVVYKNYDLSTLDYKLYNLEAECKLKVLPNDLVVLLTATSVAKHSARLWYPKTRGGEDAINEYFLNRRTKAYNPPIRKLQLRDSECDSLPDIPNAPNPNNANDCGGSGINWGLSRFSTTQ